MSQVAGLSTNTALVRQPDEAKRLGVMGSEVIYRVRSRETGGPAVVEIIADAGVGVPRHTHANEDETFMVIEGTVEFELEGRQRPVPVGAGGTVHIPRGLAHGFRNAGPATARMLILLSPGDSIDGMFEELADLPPGAGGPEIGEVCARYRITFG